MNTKENLTYKIIMSSFTKTKKNILFLTHWYPTKKEPLNGIFIKKHEQTLRLEYNVTRVHFDLLNSSGFFKVQLIKEDTNNYIVRTHSLFYKFIYHSILLQSFLFKLLIKKYLINIREFDILISNVIFPSGILGSKIAQKNKLTHYHIEHWSKFKKTLSSSFLKKRAIKALNNVESIFCVSEFLASDIKEFTSKKINIIPNVIEQDVFYNPSHKNQSNSKINFLAVANWTKPKNPFLFLDALENYHQENSNFKLTIIGSGPLLEEIKIKKYPFEINYLGVKNSTEIAIELSQSDFLLHGSDYETFSIIILEALLSGTPVIVSDVGIASEVISSKNGIICHSKEDWDKAFKSINKLNFNHEFIANEFYNKYDYQSISKLFKKQIV